MERGNGRTPAEAPSPAQSLKAAEPAADSWCPCWTKAKPNRRQRRRWLAQLAIPLVALGIFASLFVGAELAEAYLFPTISTGLRHALLTAQAALVAALVSGTVFFVMRRQQQRLAATARQLTQLLVAFQENPRSPGHFENPELVQCKEVLDCTRNDCSMNNGADRRCWQEMALNHPHRDRSQAAITLRECQQCDVYRQSCPDAMTELGEGINNLIYLLEQGAGQIGRMREEIAEKQKMAAIGQIAAGVAHEVCNPLSSISSVVQMLRRDQRNAPNAERLDLIDKHIERISAVVRQLTKFTKPEAGKYEPIDIPAIIDQVVRRIAYDPRSEKVELVFDRPAALPATYGMPAQLQQAVLNVAHNALDAMPDGGTLTFRAEERGGSVVVQVEDTGAGIAADAGRRVFEPFFTTKDPDRGSGLGLAAAYSIVQEHNGTIEYQSAVGKGTVFTIELPIRSQAPES